MDLPIRPGNEAANCAMEDSQLPTTKRITSVQIKSQNNVVEYFDTRGIAHYEVLPTAHTINLVYYLELLERQGEKVRQKRPEIFAINSCILHHDNAPAHTALSAREFLATKQIAMLEHSVYSPDLAPNEFFDPEGKGNFERKAFW